MLFNPMLRVQILDTLVPYQLTLDTFRIKNPIKSSAER